MGKETYLIGEFRDEWSRANNTEAGWTQAVWILEMAIAMC